MPLQDNIKWTSNVSFHGGMNNGGQDDGGRDDGGIRGEDGMMWQDDGAM